MEPDDQPASTIPYTPMEAMATMNSTETGRSVTCSGVVMSVNGIGTGPAMGITANAVMAGTAITNGASMKTSLLGRLRREVLLEHELHAVGQRLQQAERTVHGRALAVLHHDRPPGARTRW